ncbi:hypothetical protein ACN26Y_01995 [Micromonospora sp. WMMD558]|uniref:hypothetical protein n=1 Tax=unclassified Micromonospora TaxID=2617518 RepID=UPI0012B47240|nr:hypothetical protein [Micromonospora sp. WMMC415]QGN50407.1 hypothetical protein GKC29_28700 [Micromonospora sp. WMMC415]
MGTSLIFSLSLAYAGDLSAVGAVAPAMLVFQLTCGVLQRALAEATLLSSANAEQAAERLDCQRSVAGALAGGVVGAVVAVGSALMVPGAPIELAVAYAAGIPFAIALDIGRSAGVAAGAARSVFGETAIWLAAQLALMVAFAAVRSPLGVCLSWAVVNVVFFLASARHPDRRPLVAGLGAWVRSRRGVMGPASIDAFLVGLTPLLAVQVTAFVAGAATLGVIRIVQQLFAPLAFVSITFRRVLVYQRKADVGTTRRQDFRDGVVALSLMAAGAAVLGVAVVVGRELVPALSFIPVGYVLVAAGLEKAALGFSYGCSLSRFVRGEFTQLLRARYVMLGLTVIVAPLLTAGFGAPGYLVGSALGMLVYSVVVLALPTGQRPPVTLVRAGAQVS